MSGDSPSAGLGWPHPHTEEMHSCQATGCPTGGIFYSEAEYLSRKKTEKRQDWAEGWLEVGGGGTYG